jgi:hypothetical protein
MSTFLQKGEITADVVKRPILGGSKLIGCSVLNILVAIITERWSRLRKK